MPTSNPTLPCPLHGVCLVALLACQALGAAAPPDPKPAPPFRTLAWGPAPAPGRGMRPPARDANVAFHGQAEGALSLRLVPASGPGAPEPTLVTGSFSGFRF